MLSVIEKHSSFIGTYFCVYLDDWLVLQTSSGTVARDWLTADFLSDKAVKEAPPVKTAKAA